MNQLLLKKPAQKQPRKSALERRVARIKRTSPNVLLRYRVKISGQEEPSNICTICDVSEYLTEMMRFLEKGEEFNLKISRE